MIPWACRTCNAYLFLPRLGLFPWCSCIYFNQVSSHDCSLPAILHPTTPTLPPHPGDSLHMPSSLMLVYQLSNSKTSWRGKSQRAGSFWVMKARSSAQIQLSKSLKSGIYQGSATINGYMVRSRLWIRCGPRNWFYKWFSITTYFMIQKIFIVDSQVDIGQTVESNIAEEVWRACEWEQSSRQEVIHSVV